MTASGGARDQLSSPVSPRGPRPVSRSGIPGRADPPADLALSLDGKTNAPAARPHPSVVEPSDRAQGPDPATASCPGDNRASPRRTRLEPLGQLAAGAVLAAAKVTPWVEPELLGLRHVVPADGVCVDVGAATGFYTCVLAQLVGPTGRVHSVEPLPFAHQPWSRIARAIQGQNVRRHAIALSARPGRGALSVPVGRYGLVTGRSFLAGHDRSLGSNDEFAAHVTVAVDVDTLDRLCQREATARLDFIKLDVEGAELQVLEGGRSVIESWRPSLLVEIEARHTARYGISPADVVSWLTERGYGMHAWNEDRWQPVSQVRPEVRNYLFLA